MSSHKIVRLEQGRVTLCQEYQRSSPSRCSDYSCSKLHICRAYLAGHCKFGNDCKQDHNCRNASNRNILHNFQLESIYCDENLREIFNYVMPKVCLDYQTREGCKRRDNCYFLHICGKFAKGKCFNRSCEMSHDYKTGQNFKLMQHHKIDVSTADCLVNAIMADGHYTKGLMRCSCPKAKEKYTSQDSLASDEGSDRKNQERGQRGGRGRGRGIPDVAGRSGSCTNLGGFNQAQADRGRSEDRGNRGGRGGRGSRGAVRGSRGGSHGGSNVDLHEDYHGRRGSGQERGGGRGHFEDRGNRGGRGGRGPRGAARGSRGGNHGGSNFDFDADYPGRHENAEFQAFDTARNEGGRGRGGRGGPSRGFYESNRGRGQGRDQGSKQNVEAAANLQDRDENKRGRGKQRQRRRGGRGRRKKQNQAADTKSDTSSDSNNEAYSGEEDIDSDTDLYTSNIAMQNVKKDVSTTEKELSDLKNLVHSLSNKLNIDSSGREETPTEKLNIPTDDDEVKEVIVSYLRERGGWVNFAMMRRDPEILHALSPFRINLEEWLFQNESKFILNKDENDKLLDVAPIISVRICFKYNTEGKCDDGKDCGYLHVCKDFIAGTCAQKCSHDPKLNHHLQEGATRSLLTKYKLDRLKANTCCRVIASTLPKICYDYNSGGCDSPQSCRWLHICQAHFLGKCDKKSVNCVNHDIKMKQCQKILKRYHLTQENNALLRRMVLPSSQDKVVASVKSDHADESDQTQAGARPKTKGSAGKNVTGEVNPDKARKDDRKHSSSGKPSNQKKDQSQTSVPEICEPFLRRACKSKPCPNLHHKLPYLWQFQNEGNWMDMPEEMNVEIEREYCEVNSGRWSSNIKMSTSDRLDLPFSGRIDIIFEVTPMKLKSWRYCEQGDLTDTPFNVSVRRLSTLSEVLAERFKTLATVWRWYYNMGDSDTWHTNEETNSQEAYNVEQRYLKKNPTYTFQNMCLNFDQMTLTHLDTGDKAFVRRRPVYASKDDVAEKLRAATAKLSLPQPQERKSFSIYPPYWSTMEENDTVKLVKLDPGPEYANIEQSFTKSMGGVAQIQRIRRIQNADLWEQYLCEKQVIESDASKKLEEKYYFYTCEPDMVDFLYKYGLVVSEIVGGGSPVEDLGKGFYFAKDARLLHNVGKFRPDECVLFLCKILIGSRKVGSIGDAYSKVVYDTFTSRDEAVILKVENRQCYPEYAIYYKTTAGDQLPAHERPPPYSPTVQTVGPTNVPLYPELSSPLQYPNPDYLAHIPPPSAPPLHHGPVPTYPQPVKADRFTSFDDFSSSQDMYQSESYRLYPNLQPSDVARVRTRSYPHERGRYTSSKNEQCSIQ